MRGRGSTPSAIDGCRVASQTDTRPKRDDRREQPGRTPHAGLRQLHGSHPDRGRPRPHRCRTSCRCTALRGSRRMPRDDAQSQSGPSITGGVTMTRMRSLVLGSLVVLAVTTTACGQAVDRLGNEPAAPVTLRAETPFDPRRGRSPTRKRSRQRRTTLVRLALLRDREYDSGRRARHHRAGANPGRSMSASWARERGRATASTAIDALHAPFLVDSYDLERSGPRQLDPRRCRLPASTRSGSRRSGSCRGGCACWAE